jgi:hypothetical protein
MGAPPRRPRGHKRADFDAVYHHLLSTTVSYAWRLSRLSPLAGVYDILLLQPVCNLILQRLATLQQAIFNTVRFLSLLKSFVQISYYCCVSVDNSRAAEPPAAVCTPSLLDAAPRRPSPCNLKNTFVDACVCGCVRFVDCGFGRPVSGTRACGHWQQRRRPTASGLLCGKHERALAAAAAAAAAAATALRRRLLHAASALRPLISPVNQLCEGTHSQASIRASRSDANGSSGHLLSPLRLAGLIRCWSSALVNTSTAAFLRLRRCRADGARSSVARSAPRHTVENI